ncbi:MAG: hypothetical protein JSS43_08830 [Proteobacteria bacterium]|nr:hypothetical protein [Pseudomonadota bacterium]
MSRRSMLTILAAMTAGPAALAQTTSPVRVRGTIDAVMPTAISVTTRGGETLTLQLADPVSVVWVVALPMDAIQPHAFIGVTSVPGEGGARKALEVHVFPEAMRGAGEGHRPFDLAPDSTMTNGTVGSVTAASGRTLTLAYKEGEQRIFVPESTPVVTFQAADRSALTKGAHIVGSATRNPNGTLTIARISVGKDGLVPPM